MLRDDDTHEWRKDDDGTEFRKEFRPQIERISAVLDVDAGAPVFVAGDHVDAWFSPVSGVLKVLSGGGRAGASLMDLVLPGEIVGWHDATVHSYTAVAAQRCCVLKMPLSRLRSEMKQSEGFRNVVIDKLIGRWNASNRRAVMLARGSALQRVSWFLLMLSEIEAFQVGSGDLVSIPVKRSDVARFLGLTNETVSRAVHTLDASGVIRLRKTHFFGLADEKRLRAFASIM